MKRFAKNYLKALGLVLVVALGVSAFVGAILLPIWVQNMFGGGYAFAVFGAYVLLFVGLLAGAMEEKK